MALNSLGLGLLFTAKDATKGVINKIGNQFEALEGKASKAAIGFKNAVKSFALGVGVFTAGAVGVAAAFAAAGAAGTFEQGLAGVAAVSRATAGELALLEERAIQAGIATQFSPTEAVEGLRSLTVQGFSAVEAMEALGPALDLAAGGQISVEQASTTTASALRAFGLATDQAAITTDKLLRISNATALQARDLQLAIGTVARGAGLASQSLDEMLASMGLVKNTGVDASTAASSVSSALIFMAKQGAKFKELGVNVTDAQGKFRPFLDIVLETQGVLAGQFPDAAERSAKATKLFGRFGVAAFQAISTQVTTGIRSTTGEILKGADAIAFLREQMKTAGGAAKEFTEKLLNTFEGQKTLLKGSLQTFAIVFGKPFAKALKPVVSILVFALNIMIKTVKKIPGPIKNFLAVLFVAASAGVALAGAIIAVKAALVILALVFPLLTAPFAVFGVLAAKIILVILALVAVGAVLKAAWEDDFGGIATFVKTMFSRISLIFKAFGQLVRDGGFSGAVLKEINQADSGLKNFVISAFALFFRIQKFFQGFFGAFSSAVGPALSEVSMVLSEVFEEFSLILQEFGFADKKISGTGDGFKTFGAVIGSVFGAIATVVLFGVKQVVKNIRRVVTVFRLMVQWVNFVRDSVKRMVAFVGDKIGSVAGKIASLVSKAQGAAAFLGFGVGPVAVGALAGVAGSAGTAAVPAAASAGAARPGVTAAGAVAAAAPDIDQIAAGVAGAVAAAVSSRPQLIQVDLDGQKVGEGLAVNDRREAATTFGSLNQEG